MSNQPTPSIDTDDIEVTRASQSDTDSDDIEITKLHKKRPLKTTKMLIKSALTSVDERAMYTKIDKFFRTECTEKQIKKMVRIINNEDPISLRLLNWFAMKYSSTMESLEFVCADGSIELFDVKISYTARLDTHSKKFFDPFRRGKRFDYQYDRAGMVVETTLCQLNFFRWLLLHGLLEYVEEHFDYLKNKMGNHNIKEKKKKEKEEQQKKTSRIVVKKNDTKIKVHRFTEDITNKLVIHI